MNLNWLHNQLEKEINRYSIDESEYVANYLGVYGIKETVKKEFFGQPILYQFEDAQFYGPEKTDQYLEHIYGDFLKYPPAEERVFRHDYFFLDLTKPYQQYLKEHSILPHTT